MQTLITGGLVLGLCTLAFSRIVEVSTGPAYLNAAENAQPGDTILCAPGDYPSVSALRIEKDGHPAAPIVIKAKVSNPAAFDPDGKAVWGDPGQYTVTFHTNGDGIWHYGKHWIYEGIHFNGHGGSLIFHLKPGARGHLTIRNCHFSNCSYKAIKSDGGGGFLTDYILLENCTMDIGASGLMNNDGSDYLTCRNNYTFGFVDGGVRYVYFSKYGSAYSMFENNLVVGGRRGPISFGGGSMNASKFRHDDDLASAFPQASIETINSVIRNNIVIDATSGFSSSTTLNCEVYNNTVINCDYLGWVEAHHGIPKGLKVYNNLAINTAGGINNDGAYVLKIFNTVTSENPANIFMDWRPNDYKNSNFRIKPAFASAAGQGRPPYVHSDWNFHGLLSEGFYDYYGKTRKVPPAIGATEVWEPGDTQVEAPVQKEAFPVGVKVLGNPSNGFVELFFSADKNLPIADILIRDARGRHVRTIYYGPMAAGGKLLLWDGKNHAGRRVPSGHYFYRVSLGKRVMTGRFQYFN